MMPVVRVVLPTPEDVPDIKRAAVAEVNLPSSALLFGSDIDAEFDAMP